jgi:hypothetical protein
MKLVGLRKPKVRGTSGGVLAKLEAKRTFMLNSNTTIIFLLGTLIDIDMWMRLTCSVTRS